jgi:hypothetical protein
MTYKVQVDTATHDDLQRGQTATATRFFMVAADSDQDAVLTATQMAAAFRMAPGTFRLAANPATGALPLAFDQDAMPTAALLLDFPT